MRRAETYDCSTILVMPSFAYLIYLMNRSPNRRSFFVNQSVVERQIGNGFLHGVSLPGPILHLVTPSCTR